MNKLIFLSGILAFLLSNNLKAQESVCDCPGQKNTATGTFYFAWGYNKDYYSKSDIHFSNSGSDNYDFTLYDLKAKDRTGFRDILRTDLTIPQYVYRIGYYFNNKQNIGIEINFDHSKYVMINNQTAHLTGQIRGTHYDKDTLVSPSFLKFEHTNGANFLMFNAIKRQTLLKTKNKKHWLSAVVKAGPGIVIPKTDVSLFGVRLDNRFHIAGCIVGADIGIRYDFFNYWFFESSVKGSFANYTNVLTVGTGKANHSFYTLQAIASLGFSLPVKHKKKADK